MELVESKDDRASLMEIKMDDSFPPVLNYLNSFPDYPINGEEYKEKIKFNSLLDLLWDNPKAAISSTDGRATLSHAQLKQHLTDFDLTKYGVWAGDRCAVLLPNGAEMSICVFSVCSRCTCFPANPQNTAGEIKDDAESVGTKAMIVQQGQNNDYLLQVARELDLVVLELTPNANVCGLFSISLHPESPRERVKEERKESERAPHSTPSSHALVLHTSGTSGKKKIVPYTLATIVIGASCIIKSWELVPSDVDLNMMPLFHIGGIARNLFAVILSGGSVVCAPGFDPALWWDIAGPAGVTWYYAGPTMHAMIVEEAENRGRKLVKPAIRMIANAAGALLPSLAGKMKKLFACTILPGYGMTECMPISAPPPDYKLDRPGTSGHVIGPEMKIFDDQGKEVETGEVGNIVLRGCPLFHGYENNEKATKDSFFEGGWFNTGDMGKVDEDGFVYLTGRSKEVVNRGGEIISPFEIEEAFLPHPRINKIICFAAPDEVLQETIGVALVPQEGFPRVDLKELQRYCYEKLHPSKWPQCIVYMKKLPVGGGSGKPQRVRFAERAKMTALSEATPYADRHFEGVAPTTNSIKDPIIINPTPFVLDSVNDTTLAQDEVKEAYTKFGKFKRDPQAVILYVTPAHLNTETLLAHLRDSLDDYITPSVVVALDSLPKTSDGSIDEANLPAPSSGVDENFIAPRNQLEIQLVEIWQKVLGSDDPISIDADFFELGGSSLLAGRLAAAVRQKFEISVSVASVFNNKTIEMMSSLVEETIRKAALQGPDGGGGGRQRHYSVYVNKKTGVETNVRPRDANRCCALFINLLPIMFVYPIRRMTMWFVFVFSWIGLMHEGVFDSFTRYGDLCAFFLAIFFTSIAARVIMPFFGILIKWIVIGRYRAGRYPLFGGYYLRWWFVEQCLGTFGRGVFLYNSTTLRWYYKMLGAKIGKNVAISKNCNLGEFDLLTIKDNVALGDAHIRPFCMEKGTMTLKQIKIGRDSTVPIKCQIAPGSNIPSETHMGPLSSSHELSDAHPNNKDICGARFPQPNVVFRLFVGGPIIVVAEILAYLPVLSLIYFMIVSLDKTSWKAVCSGSGSPYQCYFFLILQWFTDPRRMLFYFAIRAAREVLVPWMRLLWLLVVKCLIVGEFKEGPIGGSQWTLCQYYFMRKLNPGGDLCGVAGLLGKHYEAISVIYRCLGAKIGKRVYWPGSGFVVQAYDLIEIGNDVVFGSRSILMTTDNKQARKIILKDSANIADRCVLLPGVVVGECAVMGSGALGAKGHIFPQGSISVGSKGGNAVQLTGEVAEVQPGISKFGKAFYKRDATYCVFPEAFVIFYNFVWHIIVPCAHACPLIISLLCTDLAGGKELFNAGMYAVVGVIIGFFCLLFPIFCILYLLVDIMFKWCLLGRRKPGSYAWDESSYCQRWQVYLTIQNIRRGVAFGGDGVLDFLRGTHWLVLYFRALGCTIGKNTCLYPNGGDPMMTEPDLITIDDHATIDEASLIGHMNTKGNFTLNKTRVGKYASMRTMARLLAGAEMEDESTMLEHTLILSGDVAQNGSVWQGWPPELVTGELDASRGMQTLMTMTRMGANYQDNPLNNTIEILSKLGMTDDSINDTLSKEYKSLGGLSSFNKDGSSGAGPTSPRSKFAKNPVTRRLTENLLDVEE